MSGHHFEVIGCELANLLVSTDQVLSVARELAEDATEFCLEAHFHDLEALKRLSEIVPSNRYACYCWRPIADPHELKDAELAYVRNARLVFGDTSISVEEGHALPPYDWDGKPSEMVTLRLVRRHLKPLSAESAQPSPATVQLCSEIAANVLGADLSEPVKTVTEWTDDGRAHNYLMTVSRTKAASIAAELCSVFSLSGGAGSFELLGTASQIEKVQRLGRYFFDGFPTNCWSFNDGNGRTPFALARSSFLSPVLNVDSSQLTQAASTLDSLGRRVTRCGVVRRYLAWRLEHGLSPRTQGNYLLLSQQKGGCALFVGFEQYADSDPTTPQFADSASGRLERFGIKLKKVANVR